MASEPSSIFPKRFEAIGGQLGIADRMLNVFVPEVVLHRALGRRQIAMLSLWIDRGKQLRQRHVAPEGRELVGGL